MLALITSPSNERIKRVRALQRRRERDRSGLCLVEGIRATVAAVQAGAEIEQLIVAPGLLASDVGTRIVADTERVGVERVEVSNSVFERLSTRDGPQGLAAVVRQRWFALDEMGFAAGDTWVLADRPGDPGNVGTIARTIDAAGGAGMILAGASADPYDPTALRASAGAIFATQLIRSSVEEATDWARRSGASVIGSSAHDAQDYRSADYGASTLLVLGNEGEGLSPDQRELCDAVVGIPMRGTATSSLNLAVSAGILLYEIRAAHEPPAGDIGQ